MADVPAFATGVQGVDGVWPPLPKAWSYSSLRAAEECPRRWALSRATYAGLWTRPGYPPRPILPALVGDVMHRVLELILMGLHDRACRSLVDPCAVEVLRSLGGYTALTTRVIEEHIAPLEANPRVADRVAGIRSALLLQVPAIRQRVQAILTRTDLRYASHAEHGSDDTHRRSLMEGSNPEVELRAPELKFAGRADLITIDETGCSITDYKTGAPDPHHADQIRAYSLLWSRDAEVNPENIPVRRLLLSYATHDERIGPPTDAELGALARQLLERIAKVEGQLRFRPPAARPALSMCRLCSVRHLCEEYWSGPAASALGSPTLDFVDCEVIIVSRNGPRSWIVETDAQPRSALLRTPTETPGFAPGDKVRLLDLAQAQDDDTSRFTLTMTQASEVYKLRQQGAS